MDYSSEVVDVAFVEIWRELDHLLEFGYVFGFIPEDPIVMDDGEVKWLGCLVK